MGHCHEVHLLQCPGVLALLLHDLLRQGLDALRPALFSLDVAHNGLEKILDLLLTAVQTVCCETKFLGRLGANLTK